MSYQKTGRVTNDFNPAHERNMLKQWKGGDLSALPKGWSIDSQKKYISKNVKSRALAKKKAHFASPATKHRLAAEHDKWHER